MKQESPTRKLERGVFILSRVLSLILILGFGLILTLIFVSTMTNPLSYLYLLILIPLVIAAFWVGGRLKRMKILRTLQENWGIPEIIRDRRFNDIKTLFENTADEPGTDTVIDDQTWRDLNMDEVYSKIDRTLTDPGQAVLYRMLREPVLDEAVIRSRSSIIRTFEENPELREEVQYTLSRLGQQFISNDLFVLLWGERLRVPKLKTVFTLLALAAPLSILVPIILSSGIMAILPVALFVINLFVHYIARRKYNEQLYSFPYLLGCIRTAGRLAKIKSEELDSCTSKFREIHTASKKILGKARFLFPGKDAASGNPADIFLEYLNIFLLLEVRSFYSASEEINKQIDQLKDLYLILGDLDALQSIASYRASLPVYTEPVFLKGEKDLKVENAAYPLLDDPVPASVNFTSRGVIITGSNMAGKSTFLRNIGCNVLLAQTIATCCAESYRARFFRVMSSISRTDDVIAGKSFYFVEAERILRTINSLDSSVPTLCIIDEMLSGTNSVERLRASEAIIRYMIGQNTLVICATHDMELIEKLNGQCDLYHFTGTADETGLHFDHRIKSGPATTRNAVELLEYLGYPEEITKQARE